MASANIIKIVTDNYTQEVENSSVPILVDFWAPWCAPCRAVAPILEQLAEKYSDKIKIGKLDVDEEPSLAYKFRVMSIPTLILFKDGKVVKQVVGLRPIQELEDMIKNVI
jgi:thioredoxin 1